MVDSVARTQIRFLVYNHELSFHSMGISDT